MSKSAFAEKAFDDYPAEYSLDLSKAPMYTISGITDWGASILKVYGITTWILVFVFLAVAIPCVYAYINLEQQVKKQNYTKQVTGNHVFRNSLDYYTGRTSTVHRRADLGLFSNRTEIKSSSCCV